MHCSPGGCRVKTGVRRVACGWFDGTPGRGNGAPDDGGVGVEAVAHTYGNRWARPISVPVGAAEVLRQLSSEFDVVWASAWSHNAHPAWQELLGLPAEPWPFLAVQFRKLDAVRACCSSG
ncbi:hypothetical protein AB0K15_41620 [Amycolatopsis sp. NPDC049253]|uniref:hypothetical protein n=1 Tax=Amycolatopsis sp. NPDC049253 TaxID=3155274 RepID=UPI0034434EAB